MAEKIKQMEVTDAYIANTAKYSIVVNMRRAFADIRDNFKPVQRRIIYDMFTLGATSKGRLIKSQRIVGDTMGNYHARGDSSIYDAMAPMANWWSCKVPLIGTHGNWGSFQGDGPAASRYTEAFLAPIAIDHVIGALKETDGVVDWIPNFDNSKKEPEYLPVEFPLLLVNGTSGIGLGINVYIPSHNLGEVIDATVNLIRNPDADVVLIPDHCFPCDIIDTNWKHICNTGYGNYKVRGRLEIGTWLLPRQKEPNPAIFIKSLPNGVGTDVIEAKISKLVEKKVLTQIQDVLNESNNEEVNLIVVLKKGCDPHYVKGVLYQMTDCQKNYTVNFRVVDGMSVDLQRMSYKSYLQHFIEFALLNKFRLYCCRMQQAKTELHKFSWYVFLIKSNKIDTLYKIIRGMKKGSDTEAVEKVIKEFNVTDIQARYLLKLNLSRVAPYNLAEYQARVNDLEAKIKLYDTMITDDNAIKAELIEDLLEIKEKYDKPRLCRVISATESNDIPKGSFTLVFTENNYVRKIPIQNMSGMSINAIKGDLPKFIVPVENTENVLVFDNKGKVYKLPVFKIPISDKSDSGTDIRSLIKGLTADICQVIYEPTLKQVANITNEHYACILTQGNYIKKIGLVDLLAVPPSGIIYTKLNQGDSVLDVILAPNNLDMVIYSGHKALRISINDIPQYKRSTFGVSAMNTKDNISGMNLIYPDATDIVVVTSTGKVNKFAVTGLGISQRYKAGSSVIKLSRGEYIMGICGVKDGDVLRVVTRNQEYGFNCKDIVSGSSISAGTKMIGIKDDNIISVSVLKGK